MFLIAFSLGTVFLVVVVVVPPASVPALPSLEASLTRLGSLRAELLGPALPAGPRVQCWVNTHPPNHAKKAVHVKATWGK
jgi:hypothetical protein